MANNSAPGNFREDPGYQRDHGGKIIGRGRGRNRKGQRQDGSYINEQDPTECNMNQYQANMSQRQMYPVELPPPMSGGFRYPNAQMPTYATEKAQNAGFHQQQNPPTAHQQPYHGKPQSYQVQPQWYQGMPPPPMDRHGFGQSAMEGNTNQRMCGENQTSQMTSNISNVTDECQTADNGVVYDRSRQSRDNLQSHERDPSPDRQGFQHRGETGHSGRHPGKDSDHKRDRSLDRSGSHHDEQTFRSPPYRNEKTKNYRSPEYDNHKGNRRNDRYRNDGWQGYNSHHYGNRSGGKYPRDDQRGGRKSFERGFHEVRSPDSNHNNSSDCVSPQSDGPSPRRRLRDMDPVIHLSKTLSFILRHGAKRHGFNMMPGGFLYVEDILELPDLQTYTVENVESVVKSNDKQRFALEKDSETGKLKIRANQGHSIEVEGLELKPILKAEDAPVVIHGTYHASWEIIKREGLHKMRRNHIHFAAGEPGESGVISGMRSTCEVMIKINLEKALKDGIKFFRSANNVILSPGDAKGYIYPCYFDTAVSRSPYQKLPFNENISSENVSPKIPGLQPNDGGRKKKRNKNANKERKHDHETKIEKDVVKESPEDLLSQTSLQYEDGPTPEYWDEELTENSATNAVSVTESEPQSDVRGQDKEATNADGVTESEPQSDVRRQDKEVCDEEEEEEGANQRQFTRQASQEDAKTKDEMSTLEISEPVCCISAVDYLKTQKAVAIYCHISDDERLKNIICVCDEKAYNFKINDNLMTEGDLHKFFSEKQPLKIFHGIAWPARVLFGEYSIMLDGTDVSDTKILYDNVSATADFSSSELNALNFHIDEWPSWDGNVDIFVEKCQAMLKAHELMLSWCKNKLPKREIFKEAESLIDKEKHAEAKKAKRTKKGKKKS